MFIRKISLYDFRLFEQKTIDFKDKINIVFGDNGTGKTSILEAIIMLTGLRSFRTNKEIDLINYRSKEAVTSGLLSIDNISYRVSLSLTTDKRTLHINDEKVRRFSDYIGIFKCVSVIPEDLYFFDDQPKKRRRFLDENISQFDKEYLLNLSKYSTLYKNKARLLKEKDIDRKLFESINEQLSSLGFLLSKKRENILNDLSPIVNNLFSSFPTKHKNIIFKYISGYKQYSNEHELLTQYNEMLDKEIEKKTPLIGLNFDDFNAFSDKMNVESYFSQGEKKILVLTLKLAIAEKIKNISSVYPVILLDDIFSELDSNNRTVLLNIINNFGQIIISSSDYLKHFENKNINMITISNMNRFKLVDVIDIPENEEIVNMFHRMESDVYGIKVLEGGTYLEFVNNLKLHKNKETLPQGRVLADMYLMLDLYHNRYVGLINFRHYLNAFLEKVGGHIGYAIDPLYQGLGFGKLQLKLMIEKIKKEHPEIENVLITCDKSNIRSSKTILSNNGVHIDDYYNDELNFVISRFSIKIKD